MKGKNVKKIIDLHVHSYVSDGSYRPAELAWLAKDRGLAAWALTDHDNISGCREAAEASVQAGVEFINGMELTAGFEGHKLHIVCLGFDPEHSAWKKVYSRVRAVKEARLDDIIEYVHNKGVDISMEQVRQFAYGPLDRYAIMRYLVSLHMYDRAQPLWDNYLDPAVQEFGLSVNISAEEALPLVHEAGGKTSLAHYHKNIGLKGLTRAEQEDSIRRLHELGLDGMEAYYPNYTDEDREFAAHMIAKYNLLATGGTDFHGTNRPGIELGTGIDCNMQVPYEFFKKLKK